MEWKAEDYLFDQVGLVNIISPTPFVLERLDDSPNIYGFETVIPIAVCSETAGKICHLKFTEPYRNNLLDLGYAGTHDFQDALNNRKVLLAEKIRDIMRIARESMEVESMDFISSGKHCHLQARLVTSMDECYIYLIRIDVLTNSRVFRKIKDMNDTLRTLYSIYDMVVLLNLRSNTLLPVYMCELFDRIEESENISAEISEYVQKNVHPEDRERCWAFLNPADMWERLENENEGFLLSYFRSRNKYSRFVWKRFVLVRSYDIGEEEKAVLGVHALSMDKLSMLLRESKPFLSDNFKGEAGDELDFFK